MWIKVATLSGLRNKLAYLFFNSLSFGSEETEPRSRAVVAAKNVLPEIITSYRLHFALKLCFLAGLENLQF